MEIVLCVTGSIAATETIKLAREFRRQGHSVKAFMTKEATKIIHPNALEFATGDDVVLDLTGKIEHVRYSQADLILVAPATANTISKFAYKISDNPVNTLLITAQGHNTPIVFVPSMHDSMYDAVSENVEKLKEEGIEARPFWKPIHLQKPYENCPKTETHFTDSLWQRIITLPCSTNITDEELNVVKEAVEQVLAVFLEPST